MYRCIYKIAVWQKGSKELIIWVGIESLTIVVGENIKTKGWLFFVREDVGGYLLGARRQATKPKSRGEWIKEWRNWAEVEIRKFTGELFSASIDPALISRLSMMRTARFFHSLSFQRYLTVFPGKKMTPNRSCIFKDGRVTQINKMPRYRWRPTWWLRRYREWSTCKILCGFAWVCSVIMSNLIALTWTVLTCYCDKFVSSFVTSVWPNFRSKVLLPWETSSQGARKFTTSNEKENLPTITPSVIEILQELLSFYA